MALNCISIKVSPEAQHLADLQWEMLTKRLKYGGNKARNARRRLQVHWSKETLEEHLPAFFYTLAPCEKCGKMTKPDDLCNDRFCRGCHVSIGFEECVDGSWVERQRAAAGFPARKETSDGHQRGLEEGA